MDFNSKQSGIRQTILHIPVHGYSSIERDMGMLLLLYLVLTVSVCIAKPPSPHLVFIVADDLGWNDVGYHNPDIISPTIDYLAQSGIILNQSYVQPLCSPSRSAFLTGVYPFRLGTQHLVILNNQPVCVPLSRKFLPQVLKANGYVTHMVGKWHLGFCQWECTPTYRGFDSFYGYYNADEDYFSKITDKGLDFRFNTTADREAVGNYSAYQYASRADDIIKSHDPDQPLFLYLPFQNVHEPLEVPEKYIKLYPNIKDENRRNFSAMVTALDDAIAKVVTSLKTYNLYDDTLIVFTGDNGGWTTYGGNNYPLRGGKFTIFEGGTRVPAFLHGKMLQSQGQVYNGMMHAVDWFSTVVKALNITYSDPDQDSLSQWESINSLGPSQRTEFIYNLDYMFPPVQGESAIRVGDFKLIEGFPGLYQDWYKPAQLYQGINITTDDLNFDSSLPESINQMLSQGMFQYLFNVKDDPTEHNNLYDQLPDVVKQLQDRLNEYKKKYVPPDFPLPTPKADPKNFGGAWTPGWC
ncbi:hypothetical protein Btru_074420 [Bulinus truncatus]|nr:hypothetical protein Btru_074420 [Bulinus truncatus]